MRAVSSIGNFRESPYRRKKNNQHAKRKSFVLILIIIKSQRDKVGCWGGGNSFPSNNYVH